jgi:hypothetical protein
MFSKSQQELKSIDVIGSFVALGIVCLTAWAIVHSELRYSQVAQSEAQAREILDLGTSRSPASVGAEDRKITGHDSQLDPWGRSFLRQVVRNRYGQPLLNVVWSKGPDGVDDSSKVSIPKVLHSSSRIEFSGDDVGYVKAYE